MVRTGVGGWPRELCTRVRGLTRVLGRTIAGMEAREGPRHRVQRRGEGAFTPLPLGGRFERHQHRLLLDVCWRAHRAVVVNIDGYAGSAAATQLLVVAVRYLGSERCERRVSVRCGRVVAVRIALTCMASCECWSDHRSHSTVRRRRRRSRRRRCRRSRHRCTTAAAAMRGVPRQRFAATGIGRHRWATPLSARLEPRLKRSRIRPCRRHVLTYRKTHSQDSPRRDISVDLPTPPTPQAPPTPAASAPPPRSPTQG